MTDIAAPTASTLPAGWPWTPLGAPGATAAPAATPAGRRPAPAPAPAPVHPVALPRPRLAGIDDLISGLLLIALGVGITVVTLSMHLPIFIVAFGPVIAGLRQIGRGLKRLAG